MELKRNLLNFTIPIVFVIICIYVCESSPISYREDTMEESTTASVYNDRLKFKKEYKNALTNISNTRNSHFKSGFLLKPRNKEERKALYKVKSVMQGERTLKQKDDDDDDDDDGGEYEGLDYNNAEDTGKKSSVNKCSGKQNNQVPMMIIREVDMLAMQIPMQDSQNGKDKGKEQVEERKCEGKQWSDWSPCTKKCGDGFQSRWRYLPGATRGEQQSRPCHLADCPPQEYQPQMYDYVNTSL